MLSIKNLTLQTRFTILENTSYDFVPGHVYGVIAPNGTGKTSLFRAIDQLIPIKSGQIYLDDSNKPAQQNVFFFESPTWFNPHLTGLDYLTCIKEVYASALDIVDTISIFDIQSFVKLPIRKYSLGMQQKLILTMYLLSNAPYLIMDEITNGLDDSSREIFMTTISQLRLQGTTILLSSHYKQDLDQICTDFVAITDKKLVTV